MIFFIALHYTMKFKLTIIFDTGTDNKRRLINISDLARQYGQAMCTALMALYAFTHCDSTSALKRIGKIKLIKLLQKSEIFHETLSETWGFMANV